ncbi:MAG: single-stranded DNA-binding protein [Treponema sp.]|nr:single-stranded DNA-binding protein [Treponema sp.]
MTQLNSLILEGNITRIPDVRETPNGFKVCTVPVAVNRFYRNSAGESTQEVSFFDVEAFGKLADFCEQNSDVGRGLRVVGRLKQARWKTTDGKSASRVSIIAEHIEFKPRIKKSMEAEPDTAALADADETDVAANEQLEAEELAF